MLPAPRTTAEIVFEDDHEELSASVFATFLLHFRNVYHAIEESRSPVPPYGASVEEYRAFWNRLPPAAVFRSLRPHPRPRFGYDPIWAEEYGANDTLKISRISKNSPLEITLCGATVALTVAVILSGGSIDASLKGVKARLPPLGKGIQELRKALNEKFRND